MSPAVEWGSRPSVGCRARVTTNHGYAHIATLFSLALASEQILANLTISGYDTPARVPDGDHKRPPILLSHCVPP